MTSRRTDPELVLPRIAATLGAREGLAEYIDEKRMLRLLDDVEQILPCAPALVELLGSCPNLKLLAELELGFESRWEVSRE